jgi:hypothetical protein
VNKNNIKIKLTEREMVWSVLKRFKISAGDIMNTTRQLSVQKEAYDLLTS